MKKIIAVTMLLILVACAPALTEKSTFAPSEEQLASAKSAVVYDLKDPSSAQFRNMRGIQAKAETGKSATYICGEVNARNSFGGYVGFTPFIYNIKDNTAALANRTDGRVNMFDRALFNQYC